MWNNDMWYEIHCLMRANKPIEEGTEPKVQAEGKLTDKSSVKEVSNTTEPTHEENDEPISKIDEQYERTRPLYESGRKSKFFDVIFIAFVLTILAFVWVYIYKKPIPFAIKRILGMDDTLYPEVYEKMFQNK